MMEWALVGGSWLCGHDGPALCSGDNAQRNNSLALRPSVCCQKRRLFVFQLPQIFYNYKLGQARRSLMSHGHQLTTWYLQ